MKRVSSIFISILVLSVFWRCEEDIAVSCLDELKHNTPYLSEIFEENYLDIYGKWALYNVSGGIAGVGHDFSAESYLQIIEYGLYQFLIGDTVINCGRIIIPDTDIFLIEFENPTIIDVPYALRFTGRDTLLLDPHCFDCFYYHYKRVE